MTAGVVDHLPHDDRLPVVGFIVLQVSGAAHVDFNLQLDAQLAAVAQDGGVDRWQTGGAEVLIVPLRPATILHGTIHKSDFVAAANGIVPASGTFPRLQHSAVIAKRAQFVACHKAGDAAAQDNNLDTLP